MDIKFPIRSFTTVLSLWATSEDLQPRHDRNANILQYLVIQLPGTWGDKAFGDSNFTT